MMVTSFRSLGVLCVLVATLSMARASSDGSYLIGTGDERLRFL